MGAGGRRTRGEDAVSKSFQRPRVGPACLKILARDVLPRDVCVRYLHQLLAPIFSHISHDES